MEKREIDGTPPRSGGLYLPLPDVRSLSTIRPFSSDISHCFPPALMNPRGTDHARCAPGITNL